MNILLVSAFHYIVFVQQYLPFVILSENYLEQHQITPIMQLIGDLKLSLESLDDLLTGYSYPNSAQKLLGKYRQELDASIEVQHSTNPHLCHPLEIVHALQENVNDDTIVNLDVGSHYIWMARYFRSYEPRHLLISNGMQTLGVGLPWAITSSLLYPNQKSVAVCGDGEFLFSGAELSTAVQHNLNLVVVV